MKQTGRSYQESSCMLICPAESCQARLCCLYALGRAGTLSSRFLEY